MKKAKFFPWFLLAFLVSCDILRVSPFEVEGWNPGEGYHKDPSSLEISLLLSHDCDKIKVEEAFSILEDGKKIKGKILWEGRRFFFRPASPLEINRNYLISLETGAQDMDGLSLERKFEASFTTQPPGERLKLLSLKPKHEGIISESRESVELFFSEEITVNSCINSISFAPSVDGSWRLDGDGKTARFTPLDPWKHGSAYRINVKGDFKDSKGMSLGDDSTSFFSVALGEDLEKPELISAWAVNPGLETEIKSGVEFTGWESFTGLRLDFSEPVDTSSVKDSLSAEPNADMVMETGPGFADSVFFRFAEKPVWNERYLLRLKNGVLDEAGNESETEKTFFVKTDGPLSKPPFLIGMRLPMAPGKKDTDGQEAISFSTSDLFENLPIDPGADRYPYTVGVETWIELYFDTASDTGVDIMSIMEHFRVDVTNGAIDFSPRLIVDSDFTWADAEPEWASYKRIEIRGVLTNTVNSGVVSFLILQGLEDSRGNSNQKVSRISLLK